MKIPTPARFLFLALATAAWGEDVWTTDYRTSVNGAITTGDDLLFVTPQPAGPRPVLFTDSVNGISGGTVTMRDDSELRVSASSGIASGVQRFYEVARLHVLGNDFIAGGSQNFFGSLSRLEIAANAKLNGGLQYFQGSSQLRVLAGGTLDGGVQQFYDSSELDVYAVILQPTIGGGTMRIGEGLAGGSQTFFDASKLNVRAGGISHRRDAVVLPLGQLHRHERGNPRPGRRLPAFLRYVVDDRQRTGQCVHFP